jgi:radical SAM protein with 4Fe4S-binding SPASM domain
VTFEDGLPLCLLPRESWQHVVACECGWSLATVDPLGNVRRCACNPRQLGNLFTSSLAFLWRESLRDFRSQAWNSAACNRCLAFARCGGGCAVSRYSEIGYAVDAFSDQFKPIVTPSADLRPRSRFRGQTVFSIAGDSSH